MRCILAVKFSGKTSYGNVNEDEFKLMYEKHDFFKQMWPYMKNSFLMDGDYKLGKPHTIESEAQQLSGGQVHPMQYRFS